MRLLSTKILNDSQKNILPLAYLDYKEYNAISVSPVAFSFPQNAQNLIFTSKNAVRAVLRKKNKLSQPCFCVGNQTASLLLEAECKVLFQANSASELVQYIVQNHSADYFVFFSGSLRLDILPKGLAAHSISLLEIVVYNTALNSTQFDNLFDAVLFFSPSAVQSFVQANALENTTAICIGKTTGDEAFQYTDQIIIADSPSIVDTLQAFNSFYTLKK